VDLLAGNFHIGIYRVFAMRLQRNVYI
jgi:hypothetical protein